MVNYQPLIFQNRVFELINSIFRTLDYERYGYIVSHFKPQTNMNISPNLTPIKFHFYSLKFTPYKKDLETETSMSILKQVITFVSNERKEGRGYLIDKNRNRSNEASRELFMTGAFFMLKENRIRCSIALLRTGRVPKIKPTDEFKLIPIADIGTIAEETHFFIDYSRKGYAVICLEHNYHGPRISDIEYYLRNVARYKLNLSKATEVDLFMNNTMDETLESLKNVLNFDVKMQPSSIAQLDNDIVGQYFTGINSIGNKLKPNYIKVEALFQNPGGHVQSTQLNTEANNMVRALIRRFKAKPYNIDCFENFVVRYENKDGQEEVFNLLKGKHEIIKELDLKAIKKKREIYEAIELDFDEFMNNLS